MKLLLAGPGTGKTYKIREIIKQCQDLNKILILSFTNATIHDLSKSFKESNLDIKERNCLTLHKYALTINHQKNLHILNAVEVETLESYARKFNVSFKDLCKTLGCVTFEQMIVNTIAYIKSNPAYLNELIGDIELLVVDEYQDFNPSERELISLVSKHAREAIILGDDDQCVYEFKDADIEGILELNDDGAVEKIDHHNICYRCPDSIVDACSALINKNQRRAKKDWIKNGKNGEVFFNQFKTQDQTVDFVIKEIEEIKKREPKASIMILSAVELAVEGIASGLEAKNILHNNLWSLKLDLERLKRIWEVRAILGNKKILNLLFLIHKGIKNKKKLLTNIYKIISKNLGVDNVLSFIGQERLIDGMLLTLIKSNPTLTSVLEKDEYDSFEKYLNESSLQIDLEKLSKLILEPVPFDQNGINLLSIHKSKGLEADCVFIVGVVEGILPNVLYGLDSVEMQRRLLFVGMSRAKTKLNLVSTIEWDGKHVHKVDKKQFKYDYRSKKYHGRTSSFVSELELL